MNEIQSNLQNKIDPEICSILMKKIPLIDLRAPIEFKKGAFPTSCNLPIINDEERKWIGSNYKNYGRESAEKLGYELVSGRKREKRIHAWNQFIQKNPKAHLYCWRGGMRSNIASKWLKDIGLNIPTINGGYKALRHTCLNIIESVKNDNKRWIIIGGRTGSGKTTLISSIYNSIDLERLANHRGSAFGQKQNPQPTSINFENMLAIKYLQHSQNILVLEDESRGIGKLTIPESWYQKMQTSELIILTLPTKDRIENIQKEYIEYPIKIGVPLDTLKNSLQNSLLRIKNRLGGNDYRLIHKKMKNAFNSALLESHKDWIHHILKIYYDPMYNYQIKQKKQRCIIEGNKQVICDFLKNQ